MDREIKIQPKFYPSKTIKKTTHMGLYIRECYIDRELHQKQSDIRNVLIAGVSNAGEARNIALRHSEREFTAIDLNSKIIARANAVHQAPNLRYEVADLTNLPYDDHKFDFIIASDILEHIPNDQAAVREMGRVVKKGRDVFIHVPFNYGITTIPDHVRPGYFPRDFDRLMPEAGLTPVRTYITFVEGREAEMYRLWNTLRNVSDDTGKPVLQDGILNHMRKNIEAMVVDYQPTVHVRGSGVATLARKQ